MIATAEKIERNHIHVTFDNYYVHAFRILGTTEYRIDAYELANPKTSNHTQLLSYNGKSYGAIYSAIDDTSYRHLPFGEERAEAIYKARAKAYAKAYSIIFAAFPSLVIDMRMWFDDGTIRLNLTGQGDTFRHRATKLFMGKDSEFYNDWLSVYVERQEARKRYLYDLCKDDQKDSLTPTMERIDRDISLFLLGNFYAYKIVWRQPDGRLLSVFAADDLAVEYQQGQTSYAAPELMASKLGLFCYTNLQKAKGSWIGLNYEIWLVQIGNVISPPEQISVMAHSKNHVLDSETGKNAIDWNGIVMTDSVTLIEKICNNVPL